MRKLPAWTVLLFSLSVLLAFSPNLLHVYGIHNDYEMLYFRSHGFFHPEAEALFAIARPVAGFLTNVPMFFVQKLDDFRWTRIFSLLTVCFLGMQMMAICIHDLRAKAPDALAIAISTFLALPFIYSVLAATAWPLHLLTVALAFCAYALLSRANPQLMAFRGLVERRDYGAVLWQFFSYCRLRSVWSAALVYQIAFFDYPPNALILATFPVVVVLFSHAPRPYRMLIALRDIAFIGLNVVLFAAVTKLLYLPVVRLFTSYGSGVAANSDPLTDRLAATYRFAFNLVPDEALRRLGGLVRVGGDLWFLPQANFRFVVAVVILAAVVFAVGGGVVRGLRGKPGQAAESVTLPPLALASWGPGIFAVVAVVVVCFVVSGASVWASATGFISYRTIMVPTVILAIVFLYAVRSLAEGLWFEVGNRLWVSRMGNAAVATVACAAVAANFYANDATMRLARNELGYIKSIVRQAIKRKSEAIVLIDRRPFMLPEDLVAVADQQGRAVPPYELGCFSGYCLQTTAIVHIAAEELGAAVDQFAVNSARAGFPVPGLTCELVTDPTKGLPPNSSKQSILTIRWYHSMKNIVCVDYSLDWHSLDPRPPG